MYVKLYDHPVMVDDRSIVGLSPIPSLDHQPTNMSPGRQLGELT